MTIKGKEGVAIARLIADDGVRVIGLVYLWSTAELGIRWLSRERNVKFIEPKISVELLSAAVSSSKVVAFLETLSSIPFSEDE